MSDSVPESPWIDLASTQEDLPLSNIGKVIVLFLAFDPFSSIVSVCFGKQSTSRYCKVRGRLKPTNMVQNRNLFFPNPEINSPNHGGSNKGTVCKR